MKKLLTYIVFISAVTIWSCEDVIDLEVPDGEVKLVVEGLLTDIDTVHTIILSKTAPYFSGKQTPRISGATVYLTNSAGETLYFTESIFGSGKYEIRHVVKDKVQYQLNIITPQGKQYISYVEELQRVPPIDSLYQSDEFLEEIPNYRKAGYYVNLTTTEPEGIGDHYQWTIYVNGIKIINPFNIYVIDDRLYDGNPIVDWDIIYGVIPGDRVDVRQMSISERGYRFWYLLQLQMQNFGSPFDTPPASIEGNMYNIKDKDEKVLGFFGISRVSTASIIIEKR